MTFESQIDYQRWRRYRDHTVVTMVDFVLTKRL